MHYLKLFLLFLSALGLLANAQLVQADDESWLDWFSSTTPVQRIQVSAPFIALRTGPADVYPVTHSAEQGEWLEILYRKTLWFKLRDERGREGWAHIRDIESTLDGSGDQVAIKAPKFDDFRTRRWEAGLLMGEHDDEPVNALYLGYWLTNNISTELWAEQVLGKQDERQIVALKLVHQPFAEWRYSPFFSLGIGSARIKPKAVLLERKDSDDELATVGLGMRIYVNERFFVRAEVSEYKFFTKDESNEEAKQWKLGLSVFF